MRGWGDTLQKRGHASTNSRGPRLAMRNRYLMTIKNDSLHHFLIDLPFILMAELPRTAYAAVTNPKVLLGMLDLARTWPSAKRKRRLIRDRLAVDDSDIRHWFVGRW